eukprot:TRINITY_DN2_c0_g1_i1.p1 TRINITY_DN2_c0_g1~~TRINITY_DN2_c0_g1_i1.p1  ORF type:complete len:221 (+),score=87.10 TRINITY_DN2_c0_g1_i1:77-739(+)
MPKHNNAVPRNHFRKHWNPESSQKGHIKTFFQQALQKKARRVRRQQKAAKAFPRPTDALRPVVQACTQRYNMKSRAGRGFTLTELKAAGLCAKYARTVGISVDHRRKNHSEESLAKNTQRLKEYLSKLVLYPLQGKKKATKGPVAEATGDALKNVVQAKTPLAEGLKVVAKAEEPRDLTKEEQTRHIYNFLRAQKRNEKFVGIRLARKKRAEKKDDAPKN